jgi:hypothetical protein
MNSNLRKLGPGSLHDSASSVQTGRTRLSKSSIFREIGLSADFLRLDLTRFLANLASSLNEMC